MMKYKLAILDVHPIQYRAPLFKRLAQHPRVDLSVYYCSNYGVTEKLDFEFGIKFKWDISLLEGYKYSFLRNYSFFSSPIRPWGLFNFGIIRELIRHRYDAIIIYGYFFLLNWFISCVSPFLKIPVIFTGETVLRKRPQAIKNIFLRIFFHNVRACLYIGTKSLEFYRYLKIPQERLFFTPYSVSNDFFIRQIERLRCQKEQIKEENGIPKELPIILYASKMISRKRPQDVLRAFGKIYEKAILVFVGDGKLRFSLEDYVCKNQIKNVFFLGFKNQSELLRYYAMSDIFVLPSAYESWGLAINEAMCACLPIITTDAVASAYDLVREGDNGFVLKVGDIEGLTKSLEYLISNIQKRYEMSLKSLEIISNWNYDACVNGIINALEFVGNRTKI